MTGSFLRVLHATALFCLVHGTTALSQTSPQKQREASPSNDSAARFVRRVLADTEDIWDLLFLRAGQKYEKPVLVLFSGETFTACGKGESIVGPFYCPLDRKVYLDLDFFRELKEVHGAPGDFAQAYVIAHEIGHHIQNLLGIEEKVQTLSKRAQETGEQAIANDLSIRTELQADCLAGVWAHHTHRINLRLEAGDIESGLKAASQIGDDTMQKRTEGKVVPETFTHGSAVQRMRWFRMGVEGGKLSACDTFGVKTP
jgi:uncharacterized protein